MLIEIHHWADQAKFARTGGEMVAMAVRLARAYTKKDKIMIWLSRVARLVFGNKRQR